MGWEGVDAVYYIGKMISQEKLSGLVKLPCKIVQFGFRKNMGTEAILALRIIIQKRIRKDMQTFIAYVDIEKAFDNVIWTLMFNMMTRVGIRRQETAV